MNKIITENRIPMAITIPDDIRKIQAVFNSVNKQLYVVGGSIRDALLGKAPKDWDLATDATPDEVIGLLRKQDFITNILETGKSFGVVNAITINDEYEIATLRADVGSSDGRRPDSVVFADINTDANRRDLTINSIYYDLNTNEIIDLVGGVSDLKNGIIRTVGKAEDRFDEDKLRILRAIRFAGRFGSKVSDDINSILSKGVDLSQISSERIRDEFIKGIKTSKSTKHFLGMINQYDLFKQIFPNLLNGRISPSLFIEDKDPEVVIAILLTDVVGAGDAKQVQSGLNKLSYSTSEIKNIVFLIMLNKLKSDTAPILKKMQNNTNVTPEQIRKYANFVGLDTKLIDAFIEYHFTVNGNDVMQKYNVTGADIGKMVHKLEVDSFNKLLT